MVAALFLVLLVLVARSYLMGSSYVRLVTVLVSETSKKEEVIFDFKNKQNTSEQQSENLSEIHQLSDCLWTDWCQS